MKKAATDKPALLVEVLAEIGGGRIVERFVKDAKNFVHGLCDGETITINPAPGVVDTLIHEAIHRMRPSWTERYVRNRTTFVLRRLSDEQIEALYSFYQAKAKRAKAIRREA